MNYLEAIEKQQDEYSRLRAENKELRRVSEILSRYVCNNLGPSVLAMCQAELSGTYKPLERSE